MPLQSLIVFDQSKALEHIERTPDNVVAGNPITNLWRCYWNENKKIHAGFWSCQDGSFLIRAHTSTEMCTILEGEAIVEMEDGVKIPLKVGDNIVIPFGIRNTWHVKNFVKKSYICYIPE